MNCPKCLSAETSVIDSRDTDERTIRRRRECEACDFRFTTYEKIELQRLNVRKRGGSTEPFEREKIIKGIQIAASDRLEKEEVVKIADEIERRVISSAENPFSTKKIGNMVINRLKKLDEVAYLRFASVYKNFQDIDSFKDELTKLKK